MESAFQRSREIRERLLAASGYRFAVVYRAMRDCSTTARSSILDEAAVLTRIRELTTHDPSP
jgi:hypothetical protein